MASSPPASASSANGGNQSEPSSDAQDAAWRGRIERWRLSPGQYHGNSYSEATESGPALRKATTVDNRMRGSSRRRTAQAAPRASGSRAALRSNTTYGARQREINILAMFPHIDVALRKVFSRFSDLQTRRSPPATDKAAPFCSNVGIASGHLSDRYYHKSFQRAPKKAWRYRSSMTVLNFMQWAMHVLCPKSL